MKCSKCNIETKLELTSWINEIDTINNIIRPYAHLRVCSNCYSDYTGQLKVIYMNKKDLQK